MKREELSSRGVTLVRQAFTLVELLVVIGVIGILIGLLMPALTRSRQQANSLKCQANLRVLGQMLQMYENDNKGWLFPVGPVDLLGRPTTLGTNVPPNERWPMKVFRIKAPDPLPFDPATYTELPYDPVKFPAEPFSNRSILCPTDLDPYESHSYVLNEHLADKGVKGGSHNFGGLTTSEVIIAGEKVTTERDYYMEAGLTAAQMSEFGRVVELHRHGAKLGSNYLYHDGHVGTLLPRDALTGIDPWDFKEPGTTQPGP
jgi:prepilin-type N-terminal cleavage/methylation domain-containing protein/prepilin-type processing-associated H-X9-DG protein